MKTNRSLAIAAACGVFFAWSAAAQDMPRRADPKLAKAGKELRESIRVFARESILPEMLKWKNQFDAAISADDRAALDDLRRDAKSLRERSRESGRAMRQAWKKEDYDALKANRNSLKGFAAERRQLMEQLRPIAERNKEILIGLAAQAKPLVASWREHGKELVREWADAHKDVLQGRDGRRVVRGLLGRYLLFGPLDEGARGKRAAVRFLLWDGSDFTRDMEEQQQAPPGQGGELDSDAGSSGISLDQNYPNPFNPSTTIRFTLPRESRATITILDESGAPVSTLADDVFSAGAHLIDFDARNLPSGTYYLQLDTGTKAIVRPMQLLK